MRGLRLIASRKSSTARSLRNTSSFSLATLCCVVSATVAQKDDTAVQIVHGAVLFAARSQSAEWRKVLTVLSGRVDIPRGRRNIAPFVFATVPSGTTATYCPSCCRRSQFGRQFSSHHQRLRLHFRRLTGALDTAIPSVLHHNARCPAPRIMQPPFWFGEGDAS